MLNCSALLLYCLCRGRVYEGRRGGELPEPASDKMCSLRWRQPGMFYILQRACSISGLHVWQLDHINLIFKLRRSHSHGSVHVVVWGPIASALHARRMHREACMLGGCLALPRRCQQQLATAGGVPERLAVLPVNGAFVKGGAEDT